MESPLNVGRLPRYVPPEGACFEVTTRCVQGRYLLPTGESFRQIAVGILARAKERFPIELYGFGGLRNHLHLLVGAREADELAGFMCYVNGNLAREAGRMIGWEERFWGRRYRPIRISDEEAAFVDRMRYLLSHGVKENLVLRCRDWPGLHCIDALTEGTDLKGVWYDRSAAYEARRRGREVGPNDHVEQVSLRLDPPPHWRHLSRQKLAGRFREIVEDIDAASVRRVALGGVPPLGAEAIRRQNPEERPPRSKKSPAPLVHAASKAARQQLKEALRLFVTAYREAAKRLRSGDYGVDFPPGCFPPPRPYVRNHEVLVRAGPVAASSLSPKHC